MLRRVSGTRRLPIKLAKTPTNGTRLVPDTSGSGRFLLRQQRADFLPQALLDRPFEKCGGDRQVGGHFHLLGLDGDRAADAHAHRLQREGERVIAPLLAKIAHVALVLRHRGGQLLLQPASGFFQTEGMGHFKV